MLTLMHRRYVLGYHRGAYLEKEEKEEGKSEPLLGARGKSRKE